MTKIGVRRRLKRSPLVGALSDSDAVGPLVVVATFVAGFWATRWIVGSRSAIKNLEGGEADALLQVWIALLGGVGGMAAALFVVSIRSLRRIWPELGPGRATLLLAWVVTVVGVIATVVATVILASPARSTDPISHGVGLATRPLTIGVAICVVPGLMFFSALRWAAVHVEAWESRRLVGIDRATTFRGWLISHATLFGFLLTLIVVATGIRRRVLLADSPSTDIPIEQVLLYGLTFAALLGLFYAIAASGISQLGRSVVDGYAPIPEPADPNLSARLDERSKLSAEIGPRGTLATFEASVIISSPLITSLVGAALS